MPPCHAVSALARYGPECPPVSAPPHCESAQWPVLNSQAYLVQVAVTECRAGQRTRALRRLTNRLTSHTVAPYHLCTGSVSGDIHAFCGIRWATGRRVPARLIDFRATATGNFKQHAAVCGPVQLERPPSRTVPQPSHASHGYGSNVHASQAMPLPA